MSDLISKSKLLKEIETWGGCVEALQEYISNMPTAFDTEKVVEQLEERKAYASGCFGVMCSDCKYTEECHEGENGYKVAFDSAIDIVKKGGCNENLL